MSTPTKDDEAAIYRHAAKFTEQSALDIAKGISGACCLKHMSPEHYRLVIACLDAERPPGLGVDQAQPVRLMTFVGADDRDIGDGVAARHGSERRASCFLLARS